MEKEEIELASDKSASDIEITVEELLDFGGSVGKVGVAPDPKRVGPASRNMKHG